MKKFYHLYGFRKDDNGDGFMEIVASGKTKKDILSAIAEQIKLGKMRINGNLDGFRTETDFQIRINDALVGGYVAQGVSLR